MPRINIQRLYIDLMGVEEAVYALYDYPETVEEYFEALHESQFRMIDVINASPINIINFGDNVHSGTLSPQLFEKYALPEYQARCKKLREAGKFTYAHFDGDNRGLTRFYQQTGMDGIEAITPVPQGDVTLEEIKEGLGDDMYLIDGIPAIYFDETYPEEVLVDCVHKILDMFAPNLVLGISDEISSTGDIERIRLVGKIVDEYNAKLEG
jgi:uroporphyrinogen-III decarboxylase